MASSKYRIKECTIILRIFHESIAGSYVMSIRVATSRVCVHVECVCICVCIMQ